MTDSRRRHRRSHAGWMSGMKRPARGGKKASWRQWIAGVPLVAILVFAILAFLYIRCFNPKLGIGLHSVRTQVLSKVEKRLPDGTRDLAGSYLLVRIEGKELKLAARTADWDSVATGDTLEVEVSPPGTGVPAAYSWKKVAPPAR